MLYADNISDMVVIDITQPELPVFKNRISGIFPVIQVPNESGAFDCVDPSKGPVVGWERTTLHNPVCFN
jgi:hypothetical protein